MTKEYIKAFHLLGEHLKNEQVLQGYIEKAFQQNTWFNAEETGHALRAWSKLLNEAELSKWLSAYSISTKEPKRVGLILAGNIPMVGFHDVCSVLLSGHMACIKLSSQDAVLIPSLLEKLVEIEPRLKAQIEYSERLNHVDAVIATGSNNTARYFEYYFSQKPHIIRKNRNSVAILTGKETNEDFVKLGEDIFRYYGQGCRNVSKLYVPEGYDFTPLLDTLQEYSYIADQSKYYNNYNYYKSIYLVNKEHHLDTGFLLLKENSSLQAPLSVLYFEYYHNLQILNQHLEDIANNIQCMVAKEKTAHTSQVLDFGETQQPGWSDYADGVDTMKFLSEL